MFVQLLFSNICDDIVRCPSHWTSLYIRSKIEKFHRIVMTMWFDKPFDIFAHNAILCYHLKRKTVWILEKLRFITSIIHQRYQYLFNDVDASPNLASYRSVSMHTQWKNSNRVYSLLFKATPTNYIEKLAFFIDQTTCTKFSISFHIF